VPLVFSLGFIAYLSAALHRADVDLARQWHSEKILSACLLYQEASYESGMAMFSLFAWQDPNAIEAHKASGKKLGDALKELKGYYDDQPEMQPIVTGLAQSTVHAYHRERGFMKFAGGSFEQYMSSDNGERALMFARQFIRSSKPIEYIMNIEAQTGVSTATSREKSWRQISASMTLAVCLSAGITFLLGALLHRDILNRLKNTKFNIAQIRKRATLLPPLRSTDEIGQLDAIIHSTGNELRSLEQQKHEMISKLAGELGRPLDTVDKAIKAVGSSASLSAKRRDLFRGAVQNSERLVRLLDDIANLDEMEDNQLEINKGQAQLDDILRLSCEAVGQIAAAKNISVKRQVADASVWTDQDRIVQVLVNLLTNAIKFSPEGSTVSLESVIANDRVQISVADQGRGIPEEFQKALFDRFSQAYTEDAANKRGFGLGLSICKLIMQQLQGDISVRSQLNEGSTFTISFPASQQILPQGSLIKSESTASRVRMTPVSWIMTGAPLWQKGLILISLPLLCQIVFVVSLATLLTQVNNEIATAEHARRMATYINLVRHSQAALLVELIFAPNLNSPGFHEAFVQAKQELVKNADLLRHEARPSELADVDALVSISGNRLELAERGLSAANGRTVVPTSGTKQKVSEIRENADALWKASSRLNMERFEHTDALLPLTARRNVERLLMAGLTANLILAIGLLLFINSSIRRRIGGIISNAELFRQRQPLRAPHPGTDEISDIDKMFYDTAQKIIRLEKFKEELVGMVGHDIRTPLTSMHGTLSLACAGALGELPPDVVSIVQEAEAESTRLINLINDMLELERSRAT